MKKLIKISRTLSAAVLAMMVLFTSQAVSAAPGDLFISEYGEGSEGNQYIELYNGTGEDIDLSLYEIWIAPDGEDWPGESFELFGTIEDGAIYIIYHPNAAQEILDAAEDSGIEARELVFDGNDAVGLAKEGSLIDVVGEGGADPGDGWEVAGVENATQDHVLLRKELFCGNTDWDASRGTNEDDSEWIVLDNEDWDNIGQHRADCEDVGGGGTPNVRINEIRIDQPSTDADEYFELFGSGSPSLDGLTYIVIGDGAAALGSGVIENVTDLSGQTLFGSYFVAAESTFTLGTADLTTGLNFENSDNVTHLLVTDFSGSNGDDLDTDDDGSLDVTPWGEIVDCVGLFEADSDTELLYCDTVVGPDGSFVPGHAILCDSWTIGDFDPAAGEDTPGEANFCAPPPPPPAAFGDIIIHEIMQNPAAVTDENGEWFEIYNNSFQDIDINGWTISDNDSDSHTIDNGGPLFVENGGYLVLGRNGDFATNGGVDVDYVYGNAFVLANGADEIVLTSSDDVLIDFVEYDGGPEFPSPTGASMSLFDIELDRNDGESWCESTTTISDEPGSDFGTPGFDNECDTPPPPPPPDEQCGDPATLISTVQGDGLTSPLLDEQVSIEGIVVGDFQDGVGTNGDLDGFFVQEEEFDDDGDPATSEGIFVFDDEFPFVDVEVGDRVRVNGIVEESFGLTRLTRVNSVEVCESGGDLPEPVELFLPTITPEDFEPYEGMYVVFPDALVITEYFNFDRFGEIILTSDRQYQPTAVFEPGSGDAADLAESNALDRIMLDDGRSDSNPDPARHPNGNEFDLDNRFRGGDWLENVTGVMDFAFGSYRIQPTQGAEYTDINPRPLEPADVGGEITVASFNVLNYFNTIDNGVDDVCGADENLECRGADDEDERERQLAKIAAAMAEINADIFGIIEVENTPGVEAMEDIVDALNDLLGISDYAYIETGVIGTDAIKVGLIYNTATVSPAGDFAILDAQEFTDPFDSGVPKNRPALAQTFSDENGALFTVVVNHLKSKGSACDDDDEDTLQGNCNATRTAAAEALADWLSSDPTASGDPDFLIIGDLNAYDKEDPIVVLTEADYTDLVAEFNGEFAYSYIFDGQLGYLDYALANSPLLPQITGVTAWHINADEPDILDYDTTFKKDAQDEIYAPDSFRSSDHDPIIVGLNLEAPAPTTSMTIVKNVVTGDRSQEFDFFYYELNQAFTLSDSESFGPVDVQPGTYNIGEAILDEWDTPDIACVDQNDTDTVLVIVTIDGRYVVGGEIQEGQQITCAFNNSGTPTAGSITIIKEVIYAADIDVDSGRDFNFFSEELGNFVLDDPLNDDADGVTNTESFTGLTPGEYTISENPNGNWIQSVVCEGDDGVVYLNPDTGATIDLDVGEDVVCTFTNERVVYDLTYEKVLGDDTAVPGDDWEFTLASLLNLVPGDIDQDFGVVAIVDAEGGTNTLTLPLDAYKVGEVVPAGYDLEQIDCGDGGLSTSPPVNDQFTIILDQDLTCTFTNVEEGPDTGSIAIIKEVIYNADIDVDSGRDFSFFSTELGNFTLDDPLNDDTDGVTNTESFTGLTPGEYTVSENPNGNWIQSVNCVGDDGVVYLNPDTGATIDLDAGEEVVCTFTNERVVYDLTYEKVLGDGAAALDSDWQFTLASLLNLVPGDIDQDFGVVTTIGGAGGSNTLTLPLDAYKVGEIVPAGYDLEQIDCGDGGVSTSPPVNDQFTIILDQDLTCTFTNVEEEPEPGTITLVKTVPVEQATNAPGFDFVTDFVGNQNLIPTGSGSVGLPPIELAPGIYNIEEVNIPNGWYLKEIDCNNENVTVNGNSVEIDLPAGEDVVCTFYNEKRSNIIIEKDVNTDDTLMLFDFQFVDGVNPPFDFQLSESGGEDGLFDALIPGDYSITEMNIPANWSLADVTCDSLTGGSIVNDAANGVTINLASGDDVTCTFINEKDDLTLERLIPDCFDAENNQYRWRVRNPHDVAIPFTLTNPAGDVILAEGIAAPNGDTVVYTDEADTTFPTILRVDGVEQPNGRKNPNVNPCAPTTGEITIVKAIDWGQDVDDAPDTMFNFTGDLGGFSLGDGDSYTMKLPAGSYDISEVYKYNWAVGSVTCDGGNPEKIARGVNIDLELGDDITCTFVNEPNCVNPRADLSAVITWDGNTAMGHVTNDSDALCTWDVGMASYKKYNEVIDEQDLFDWTDGNPVAPGETIKMTIDKPECAVQIDVFIGEVLFSLDGNRYGDRLLAWQHLYQDGYCERPMSKVDGYVSADGAGMEGVIVTLTNTQADGLTFETTTNLDGYYAFRDVPNGSYRVEISGDVLGGMDMAETSAMIEVGLGAPAIVNFTAENAVPTAVTISATATSTSSTHTMMVTIIAAVLMLATLVLWRRPERQPVSKRVDR